MPTDVGKNIKGIMDLPIGDGAKEAILYGNAHRILFGE